MKMARDSSPPLHIQSSAVIMWSNIVRYYINNYRNWCRILIGCWIHKRHPIAHPNRWAMGCLLWIFVRKFTTLQGHSTVLWYWPLLVVSPSSLARISWWWRSLFSLTSLALSLRYGSICASRVLGFVDPLPSCTCKEDVTNFLLHPLSMNWACSC